MEERRKRKGQIKKNRKVEDCCSYQEYMERVRGQLEKDSRIFQATYRVKREVKKDEKEMICFG